ncbi:phosphoadenylyl-sulfate reductase [Parahaliea aestuarii]|uniref:Adenosine 5'-phosphosulfate reductase n=1 Tax=Parahaliea aestuarii TaxID=1852021 RepID=A0A5C8ZLF0_9GAMM|nr:phosphoadenylyl-sulfate reductase [Parahaliea aestuarii]TXS89406.1 phosphoadenylyl-sulfate reductase [Parahaliea aestuarii]
MNFEELKGWITEAQNGGSRLFSSCSFQTHSLPLLHMISRINSGICIAFIDTGYHFPETLSFRDRVAEEFGLRNLVNLRSSMPKSMQKDSHGHLIYTSDPDHCCAINKVDPLDSLLLNHDYWINGVRADQSKARAEMTLVQNAPHGCKRLHPMLEWDNRKIWQYIKEFDLPRHPLDSAGYLSIGCEPCTRRIDPEQSEREARWFGMNKTECGLHTELINK